MLIDISISKNQKREYPMSERLLGYKNGLRLLVFHLVTMKHLGL